MQINNPGILDGSVTTAKIADNAVTAAKLPQAVQGSILGCSGAGTGDFTVETLSAFLDAAYGNQQGMLLCRDATGWTARTPFGSYVTLAVDTVYRPNEDGILFGSISTSGASEGVQILSDASNPPVTVLQTVFTNITSYNWIFPFCVPIRKGNYYKVARTTGTPTVTVMFIGIGY